MERKRRDDGPPPPLLIDAGRSPLLSLRFALARALCFLSFCSDGCQRETVRELPQRSEARRDVPAGHRKKQGGARGELSPSFCSFLQIRSRASSVPLPARASSRATREQPCSGSSIAGVRTPMVKELAKKRQAEKISARREEKGKSDAERERERERGEEEKKRRDPIIAKKRASLSTPGDAFSLALLPIRPPTPSFPFFSHSLSLSLSLSLFLSLFPSVHEPRPPPPPQPPLSRKERERDEAKPRAKGPLRAMPISFGAPQHRVVLGVLVACAVAGAPLLSKKVRAREQGIANMRDNVADAKDAARNARLRVGSSK